MGPATVKFTLTVDDIVDSQSFLQRPLLLMATAIGAGALLVGLGLLVAGGSVALGVAAIGYGLLDLGLVHFRPIRRWIAKHRAGRIVGTEFTFELDPDDGLRWTESNGGGVLGWSAISDIREDSRLLAFMAGGVVRATIPKRAFATTLHMAAFRDEARRLIG
jgi:hypothetical protein